MRRWLWVLIAGLLASGWSGPVTAQDYPTRAITMIVPFPAGGATDTLGAVPRRANAGNFAAAVFTEDTDRG